MSSGTGTQKSIPAGSGSVGGKKAGEGSARSRKVYEHEMTDAERFALQTVQRAQAALKVLNEAIKQGKTVAPELIDQCFDLSKAAGKMLFS